MEMLMTKVGTIIMERPSMELLSSMIDLAMLVVLSNLMVLLGTSKYTVGINLTF
jgi:hypothetical protein